MAAVVDMVAASMAVAVSWRWFPRWRRTYRRFPRRWLSGGHIGGFRAAPAFHGGGYRYGGFRHYGGFHRYGIYRPHYGYRHFHRRYYYGGYYPYYNYPRRCRVIWTYYGPRRVCRWHRWHHPYRYW